MIRSVVCGVLLLVGTVALAAAEPPGITIFAAASTTEALTTIATAYEAEHQVHITYSFGSSSLLAKQIENGAPADLFLSADDQWMDYLAQHNAVDPVSRCNLLGNVLVIVTPRSQPLAVRVEPGFSFPTAFTGRIAVGDPTHVPLGLYTKQAFTALGWWEALANRLAPAADARATLKLVELGEVDVGVVYATDAHASAKVAIAAMIPVAYHAAIRYPVALTAHARPEAAAFLAYLRGPAARAVFSAAGFTDPAGQQVRP